MTIEELEDLGHAYLDDLKDVTFEDVSMTDGVVIQIVHQQQVLLEHRYYPDPQGEVHLDLRDFIRSRASFDIPTDDNGWDNYVRQDYSGMDIVVKQDSVSYSFSALGFRSGLQSALSDIDYLRVPADFKMMVTMPNVANLSGEESVELAQAVVDHVGRREMSAVDITESDGYVVSWVVSMREVGAVSRRPFQMEYVFSDVPGMQKLVSPVYEVVNGRFEQYAFVTETGAIENIPMDGNLKYIPEMTYENVRHTEGMVQASCSRDDIWEQNSGWLTLKAADALLRLLTSSDIYKLENGNWKKILIESSSVSVSTRNSLRSVTFAWRYVKSDK